MLGKFVIYHILLLVFSSMISCKVNRTPKKHNDYGDKSLWKSEFEDELNDAMLSSRKRPNVTRVVQSSPLLSDNEVVVEKLMDTITSSEKYLKKVESIDFRLNRLDIEVHEKTNTILNKLAELAQAVHEEAMSDKLEILLDTLKTDISHIKFLIEKTPRATNDVAGTGFSEPSSVDGRLSTIETIVRGVMNGVDSIVSTMTEVKNRQSVKTFPKQELGTSLDSMSMVTEFRKALHDQQRQRRCDCSTNIGRVDRAERYPTDCHEIQMQGFNISGIYKIKPDEMEPFYILCDLTTSGGGWTVFQNRYDGSQDFYKNWVDYKYGFGNLAGEFWLGLEKLNYLTNQKLYELRVEVETQHGQEAYAGYSVFTVGPEHEGFRISTLGTYYGTAGDSLSYHAGQKFSTLDVDNDEWKEGSCSTEHGGAWWYKECDKSNLNGKYASTAEENRGQSIYWISFKGPNYPLTKTKMMIRPLPASKPVDFGEANHRVIAESLKVKPVSDKKNLRLKNLSTYDLSHRHSPHRFNADVAQNVFFPNYS